jgi:hypothetical protein
MKNLSDILNKINENQEDPQLSYPPLSELPDGEYTAMWYAWTFELEDGRKFRPNYGVKRSRRMTGFEKYLVQNGELKEL